MKYKASAPGSLMMMGEYGVLYGKQAIVLAIDREIHVTLRPRIDQRIMIRSTLGEHRTTLDLLEDHPAFRFILRSLARFHRRCIQGCDIEVSSEFSSTMGLGSSAAVTVAMIKVLDLWLHLRLTPQNMIREAHAVILAVQGLGSGADVCASVMGGVTHYCVQPFLAERLPFDCPLSVIFTGNKAKTVDAVEAVKARFAAYPILFEQIIEAINSCVIKGVEAIQQGNKIELGKLWNIQQGLMAALGVATPVINDALAWLSAQPGILGAKISGAGFGDCVIGLGAVPMVNIPHCTAIPVQITPHGVRGEIFDV